MKIVKLTAVVLAPVLMLAVFVIVASGATPYRIYVINTGSMGPTIPSKSAVIVLEQQYEIGQVITFVVGDLTITHRLVSIDENGITTTKGDANGSVDPWHVPTSQIIGGVVAAPREVGYWLVYLNNPLGLASLLVSLLACWQIWSMPGPSMSTEGTDRRVRSRRQAAARRTRRALALKSVAESRAAWSAAYIRIT